MRPWLLVAVSVLLLGGMAPSTTQALPDALTRRALKTPLAGHALMLDIARAGSRLVAVGERGVILLSDDGGASWRQADVVPSSISLTAVRFASPLDVWSVGHLGAILSSGDGGRTWRRVMDGVQAAAAIRKAAMAMMAGPTASAASAAAGQLVEDGPDKPFLALRVQGRTIVAIGAAGLALRSGDGGLTWEADPAITDPKGLHLYGIAATAAGDEAIVGEQGLVPVRHGAGDAFQPAPVDGIGTLFGVIAIGERAFLAFGMGGRVLLSIDGGARWSSLRSGLSEAITCAQLLPDGRILLGSEVGRLAVGDVRSAAFHVVAGVPQSPITAMSVGEGAVVLAGPGGPRRIELGRLGSAT